MGRHQAGWTRADNGHPLLLFLLYGQIPLRGLLQISDKSFQGANGHSLIHLISLAFCLARMIADAAQNARKRKFFSDQCQGFGILSRSDEIDVTLYIQVNWAGGLTVGRGHRATLFYDFLKALFQGLDFGYSILLRHLIFLLFRSIPSNILGGDGWRV